MKYTWVLTMLRMFLILFVGSILFHSTLMAQSQERIKVESPLISRLNEQSLFTKDGLEIRTDYRIAYFFAALNGAGYRVEEKFDKPPTYEPLYHPLRKQILLLSYNNESFQNAVREIRQYFEKHPFSLEEYLRVVLSFFANNPASNSNSHSENLSDLFPAFSTFMQSTKLEAWEHEYAFKVRNENRDLLKRLDENLAKLFEFSRINLNDSDELPDFIVINNFLDAHQRVYELLIDNKTTLILGPMEIDEKVKIIIQKRLKSLFRDEPQLGTQLKELKIWKDAFFKNANKPEVKRFCKDEVDYFLETLSRALLFEVRGDTSAQALRLFTDEMDSLGFSLHTDAINILKKFHTKEFENQALNSALSSIISKP